MPLFSVQLRLIAPSWSSDLIVPSRLPSLRAPNDHAPQSPFAERVAEENCAPSVYVSVSLSVVMVSSPAEGVRRQSIAPELRRQFAPIFARHRWRRTR